MPPPPPSLSPPKSHVKVTAVAAATGGITTRPPPFLPREVFRLLVKLETQRSHEPDVAALERRFRVPVGFARDETDEQREFLARAVTPGPGAYDPLPQVAPSDWDSDETGPPSAVFASRAPRIAVFGDPGSETKPRRRRGKHQLALTAVPPSSPYMDIPPRLGSFAHEDRGLGHVDKAADEHAPTTTISTTTIPNSRCKASGHQHTKRTSSTFGHAERSSITAGVGASSLGTSETLGPAGYDVPRLWDPSPRTGRATPDAATPAVFGACTAPRVVTWSPAQALPSSAVSTAWNASEPYNKHKQDVVRQRTYRAKAAAMAARTPSPAPKRVMTASASVPVLGRRQSGLSGAGGAPLDPFAWLRQLPHGEQRVAVLASRHGLHVPGAASGITADGAPSSEELPVPRPRLWGLHRVASTSSSLATARRLSGLPLVCVEEEGPKAEGAHEGEARPSHTSAAVTASARDDEATGSMNTVRPTHRVAEEKVAISFRMPGGLVQSVRLYASKRVHHLKTAIVRKQSRFTKEEQFDLYLLDGRKLAATDETLSAAGLGDRTMVQIVPLQQHHS